MVSLKTNHIIICSSNKNVPALKITEHKIFVFRMRQIVAQRFKIPDQFLLIIGLTQCIKKIIFEIEQVGHDRFLAEFFIGQAFFVVESFVSIYLQRGQRCQAFFEKIIDGLGESVFLQTIK